MAVPKEERVVEIIVNGQRANASLKEMSAAAAVLSNQVAKIAADDPNRAELIAQLQTMRQRIGDTRNEVAGLTQSQEQLAAAQAATVAEQQRAIAAGQASTASYNQMKTAAGLLEQQLHGLGANDPGRAALLTDLQTLRGRLEEARTAMGGVIKTEAQQRAEAEALRQAELALADAEARRKQEQVQLVVNGQRVTASMREMRGAAGELERQLDELSQGDPARGPLIQALRELRGRIHDVQQEVAGVSETTSHMRQVMAYAFGSVIGGGIEGILSKVVETGKEVFTTTAKFEKYGAILQNALGSESLAQKALADIQQMAAKTPFSVDELTSSFLKFVNRGLQPTMAEMGKLGDLAASQGKSFDQLTEAVLDAATGEFERLKEFGIAASKSGNQVSLSFKGMQQTVANTPAAIQGALLAFGEMPGVAKSMAMVAGTLEGQLSNVGDTADQVAVQWGQGLRPVFVAVLTTIGFLLGVLGAIPGFVRENRGVLLALAGALVALNVEMVEFNLLLLVEAARTKAGVVWKWASKVATDAWTLAQTELNVALLANPIGAVIALIVLLVGAIMLAYDKSEKFRSAVQSLWQMLLPLNEQMRELFDQFVAGLAELEKWWDSLGTGKSLMEVFGQVLSVQLILPLKLLVTGIQGAVDALTGLWDVGKRVANLFGAGFKVDARGWFGALREHATANAFSLGKTLFGLNPEQGKQEVKDYTDIINEELRKAQRAHATAVLAQLAAEKAARLEALQNEEAALKEKLAKAKKDSEAEMRLKQQLVTNEARQKLEDEKKTEAERRIILAEAEAARVKLAQEFYTKQAAARKAAHDKKVAEDLKHRLMEIEAEKLHQEMLAQLRHAAVVAHNREDDLAVQMSKIHTDGQLKRAALQAEAQKDIAQLTGSAKEKAARQVDIEQKLAADLALVDADTRQQQGEAFDKAVADRVKKKQEEVNRLVELEEEESERQQAAFETPLDASLKLQQEYDNLRYKIRQAAFTRELNLIEESLGKESKAFKRVAAAMEKDQKDHNKQEVAGREKTTKAKQQLLRMEMQTAGDVLQFGLDLLNQDADARRKHHALYVALSTAKVLVEGFTEVQAIWSTFSEMGPIGIALAAVETGMAAARTAVAIKNIAATNGGGDGDSSFAQGGATGSGAGLADSPWGLLMQATGVSVGSDGRLRDGTGFAVAGVVHEDEYVIPKWQLQDPQVAAVAQWLEARRLRGFDGGGHTSASSGAALPVAAASPGNDGEKLYAVLVQMLDESRTMNGRLAGVESWQRNLQVNLNLREAQAKTDELKQVQYASAIRSKG